MRGHTDVIKPDGEKMNFRTSIMTGEILENFVNQFLEMTPRDLSGSIFSKMLRGRVVLLYSVIVIEETSSVPGTHFKFGSSANN